MAEQLTTTAPYGGHRGNNMKEFSAMIGTILIAVLIALMVAL